MIFEIRGTCGDELEEEGHNVNGQGAEIDYRFKITVPMKLPKTTVYQVDKQFKEEGKIGGKEYKP